MSPLANFQSIFQNEPGPKMANGRDLQNNYRQLIEYAKIQQKPIFITRYLQPEAILISHEVWKYVCDKLANNLQIDGLPPRCPHCGYFLSDFEDFTDIDDGEL